MKVAFTGAQQGMSPQQFSAVETWLRLLSEIHDAANPGEAHEFHHGDCTGADAEAWDLAQHIGYRTFAHPGTDTSGNSPKRAHTASDVILEPKPYMERNQDMVNLAGFLLATPWQSGEALRSGTWATIRRGRARDVRGAIVFPDGRLEVMG